jgi:hypothetical protein
MSKSLDLFLIVLLKFSFSLVYGVLPKLFNEHIMKSLNIILVFIQVLMEYFAVTCMQHDVKLMWNLDHWTSKTLVFLSLNVLENYLIRGASNRSPLRFNIVSFIFEINLLKWVHSS